MDNLRIMNIGVIEPIDYTAEQKKRLESLGKVTYFNGVPDAEEVLKRAEGMDILLIDWAPIDAAIPKMKQGIKLISVPFTGVGFLPLKEASSKGIKITNAPGYSTEAVAEFGMGLMLSIVRQINKYDYEQKPITTSTLYKKNLLVLGAGNIGRRISSIAKSFGMNVSFWKRGDNLVKMISKADIVYCALPFSPETTGLIGEKEFASMKNSSYFITTSHNKIYDSKALLKALETNLAGAALDLEGTSTGDYKNEVYTLLKDNPKIILTPHVAYNTDYSVWKGYEIQIDNVEAFIKGKPLNLVN